MLTSASGSPGTSTVADAGFLPLFVVLAGRLVYEVASDGTAMWETEIAAMMSENKGAVLAAGGGGGDGAAAGSHIVGSSLSSMADGEAKELFTMLAVAPEDVPIPLAALELIWCAHREIDHHLVDWGG